MSALRKILLTCRTLTEADAKLRDHYHNQAERWGLFDGFRGRPESDAGLSDLKGVVSEKDKRLYATCYRIGSDMRRKTR